MITYEELNAGLDRIYRKCELELRGEVEYDQMSQVAHIADPDEVLSAWGVLSIAEVFQIRKDWIDGEEQLCITGVK